MEASTAQFSLSKEKLSWEPVRMVTPMMKALRSSCFCTTTLELSNLDMYNDYYVGVVLFYDVLQAHDHRQLGPTALVPQDEPVRRLLHALEELLIHYPCAAGLLVHNEADGRLGVRYPTYEHAGSSTPECFPGRSPSLCNYGVPFRVAHADVTLADLGDVSIPHPSLDLLYPREPTQGTDDNGRALPRFVMLFQVTTFKCGGFTLGHTCSHAYTDGHTAATFLQNLCSIARGASLANPPNMSPTRRAVISPRDPPSPTIHDKLIQVPKHSSQHGWNDYLHLKTATRYVFTMDALEALRARIVAKLPSQSKVCSRNQTLMALLWVAHARVRLKVQKLPGSHELGLHFPINLRRKDCIANLTEGFVGNAIYNCLVRATIQELCESPLVDVVEKINRTMGELDLSESLQSMVDYLELQIKARSWNVLVALSSLEEYTCFQECIEDFMIS